MAIIVRDRHGRYVKSRNVDGPKLDRATGRARTCPDVETRDACATSRRAGQGAQHLDGGRLPGTVRTQQREHFAATGREAHVVDCHEGVEAFGETLDHNRAIRSC